MIDSSKPPDHVNELGNRFWLDNILTDHAIKPDIHGRRLLGMHVYYVEMVDGKRTYLMVNRKSEVVEEASGIEQMGCRIDVRKYLQANLERERKSRKSKKAVGP
jgi:hypothetical protein